MKKTIRVVVGTDELGALEEPTWDLFPIMHVDQTKHLQEDGLPRKGTIVQPGMILVGIIGRTRRYDPARMPTSLELHGVAYDELRRKYGDMWYDASYYADSATSGVVEDARFESVDGHQVAVITVEGV